MQSAGVRWVKKMEPFSPGGSFGRGRPLGLPVRHQGGYCERSRANHDCVIRIVTANSS